MSDAVVVSFVGVTKSYRRGTEDLHVLRDVTLTIDRGEFVAITGPSGSGKSTILHLAAGLDQPDHGTVSLLGTPIESLNAAKRARLRRHHVGFVFQAFHLLAQLTVRENIALPALLDRAEPAAEIRRRTDELLERLSLEQQAGQLASQLSGGQMQRVAIGRALLNRPAVIFADEPTGNLDRAAGLAILDLLTDTVRELGATLVVATHDPRIASATSRRLLVVDGGVEELAAEEAT